MSSQGSDSSDPRPGEAKPRATYARFPLASPFFWNMARKMQPQITGPIHHAIVVGLVFFGAFVGRELAYNWYGEWLSAGQPTPYHDLYWRVSLGKCDGLESGGCFDWVVEHKGFGRWVVKILTKLANHPLPHHLPSHSFQLSGVDFLCFFVVGLGFPFLFGVFLPHLFRWEERRDVEEWRDAWLF